MPTGASGVLLCDRAARMRRLSLASFWTVFLLFAVGLEGLSPLSDAHNLLAANLRCACVCQVVVEKWGADVNAQASDGATPLHVAVSRGSPSAVAYLVARPDLRTGVRDNAGRTPEDIARECRRREVEVVLMTRGVGSVPGDVVMVGRPLAPRPSQHLLFVEDKSEHGEAGGFGVGGEAPSWSLAPLARLRALTSGTSASQGQGWAVAAPRSGSGSGAGSATGPLPAPRARRTHVVEPEDSLSVVRAPCPALSCPAPPSSWILRES